MPRIAKLYMILVVALGLWVLLNHGGLSNAEQFVGLAVFSILGIVFEAASIDIPGSKITVSVSFVPVLTSIFLFGPSVGVWVGALSTLSYRDIFGGKPILKNAFNFSQLGIAAWVAGQAFLLAGGRPGEISLTDPVPVGVCVIAYMFANALFSSLGIGFIQGVHPHTVFSRLIAWSVPSFVAMSPLSALAALIQLHVGYLGVLLFVLPLLLARMSLRLYRDMRQNYVETIQSLAQAIDAKDHYTRGHSERESNWPSNSLSEGYAFSPTDTSTPKVRLRPISKPLATRKGALISATITNTANTATTIRVLFTSNSSFLLGQSTPQALQRKHRRRLPKCFLPCFPVQVKKEW